MSGAKSRTKGATFEREIARQLDDLLGIQFKRDLRQYQERDRIDLIPSDPDFPFSIECKRRKIGKRWGLPVSRVAARWHLVRV